MWKKLSDKAQKIIEQAKEEAQRYGEGYISTEHILLGITAIDDGIACKAIKRVGVSVERIRIEVEKMLSIVDPNPVSELQLTPRAKRVIDLAFDEARLLNNTKIGSEHLLLGLIREGEGLAGRILQKMGLTLEIMRREVEALTNHKDNLSNEAFVMASMSNQAKASVSGNMQGLKGQSLTSIAQLTPVQALEIINVALAMKIENKQGRELLKFKKPKILAMIFEKPSLRTRVTFETAMIQMGGSGIYLSGSEIQIGKRESVADIAMNLSRWVDAVMARVYKHDVVIELDRNSSIPVINGLSDLEHPCQALADLMTFYEYKKAFDGKKLAWVGDGNNVCHSVMLLAAQVGLNIAIGTPKGYEPNEKIVAIAKEYASQSGCSIVLTNDAEEAVHSADAVYTDVWASMGQENESDKRRDIFKPYQLNSALFNKALPDAIVLHCLPAHRGEEITDDVLDGTRSAVLDQAENRLHAQKALLALLIGEH